ncbi:hypothetical protein TNCV_3574191 [Trichonephila clavipes]|nr:hypothetical protein TNCV_3574191 [Trichonephila clavipes]
MGGGIVIFDTVDGERTGRVNRSREQGLHCKQGICENKRELKKSIENSTVIGRSHSLSYATQMAFRLVSFATKNSHTIRNLERHFTTKTYSVC